MTKSQTIGARLCLAMLGAGMVLGAVPAMAQTGNPGADRPSDALSRNLRSLAENPKSLHALMGAGKAALELGDPQAAITFFGRAEEQAPGDGRIKMWLGAALVQLHQAQGALKFFGEASTLGAPETEVAAHRGLAYDLLGDPRRAQRDYRLALQSQPSAEVSRRLALSLAISGEREAALRALEGQLLIRDRAAERTKIFVLALTGDPAGAARAVQATMPAQGAAMTPFLERLPALSPSERALAVHFGHFPSHARNLPVPAPNTYASLSPSATTRAGAPDARQSALGAKPAAPAKTPPAQRQAAASEPRSQAPAAAAPQRVASAAPTDPKPKAAPARRPQPSPGAISPWAWSRGVETARRAEPASSKPAAKAPEQQAAATPTPRAAPVQQQQAAAAIPTAPDPARQQSPAPPPAALAQQQPASTVPAATGAAQQLASALSVPATQPVPTPAPPAGPAQQQAAATVAPGFSISSPQPSSAPSSAVAAAQPQQQPVSELAMVEAPAPAAGAVEERGASRLAGIASLIASLPEAAPAEERPAAAPAQATPPAAKPAAKPAVVAPAAKKEAPAKAAAAKEAPAKAAPAKAAVAAKEAPAKKPGAPAEPSRIWVQVAGGADKAALPRELARLKTKAPKLLAARTGWTTPLKATNRLLVGPFKTDKEAQEFVNELRKADLSGFAWTSDAGQKIEKLSAK